MRDIIDAVEAGDVAAVLSFLQKDPRAIDFSPFGEAPLHVAVQTGKNPIVQLLLANGADANRPGVNGLTPLHLAAARDNYEAAQIIVEKSPNVNAVDDEGLTPLMVAARRREKDIARLLLENGAEYDINSAVCLGDTARVRAILSSSPKAIAESRFKDDLLVDAVFAGVPELVKLLLVDAGLSPCVFDSSGDPPLVAAVSSSECDEGIVKLLLEHGADPHQRGASGDNAG